MTKPVDHQFSLFGFQPPAAPLKKFISKERLEEGKREMAKGNMKGAVAAMRDVRYGLENYLKRIK